jgi:macrolide transport system ATP-binding/permease protein
MASLIVHRVSFSYPGSPAQLFDRLEFGLSDGWVGVIGANGAGKSTLLQLVTDLLSPTEGTVHGPDDRVYCPQRTDHPMMELASFLQSEEGDAYRIRGKLEIDDDFIERWETLSHGERKRAQIGTCLWLRPRLLAVDEPTNHLDGHAKALVRSALRSYSGIGLLVSHDRDLLDALCSHCLFLNPPHVTLRAGGFTMGKAQGDQVMDSIVAQKRKAARERRRLAEELAERRTHQRSADTALSKRGISRKDHDAKEKIDRARVADAGAGKSLRQLEGRIRHAAQREEELAVSRPRKTGIRLSGEISPRNSLLQISSCCLPLGEERTLQVPTLWMRTDDRIALIGPNGSGKSTLLRHILSLSRLPSEKRLVIPQEIDADSSARVLEEALEMSREALGAAMTWVSRLGSDPDQLLASLLPSPGEVRKLLLATHLESHPALIVMDEPTNHMDIPSIEALEAALSQYTGGLLLVSHDLRFLRALCTTTWRIEAEDRGARDMRLQVALCPPG